MIERRRIPAPQSAIGVRKRLGPSREVDDREAPHADPAGAVQVEAFVVRTAMHGDAGHGLERRALGRAAIEVENAEDAAHGASLSRPAPPAWRAVASGRRAAAGKAGAGPSSWRPSRTAPRSTAWRRAPAAGRKARAPRAPGGREGG